MNSEQRMKYTLEVISDAESLDELRTEKYGLSYQETLEMAYDNLKSRAKMCLEEIETNNTR